MDLSQWAMLGGAMLLLRAGLAVYLCGQSRSKNALSTLFRGVAETSVAILAYWAVGDAILHDSSAALFCRSAAADPATLFLAAICVTSAGIAAGPSLERARPIVSLILAALMAGVITPLAWRWTAAGWLHEKGFIDVAGSCFVHWSAAAAGLATVLLVGPRQGKYNRDGSTNVLLGHNGVAASWGLLIMFAMWPIYVTGCILIRGGGQAEAGAIFNTILAGSAGAVVAMIYSEFRFQKLDVLLVFAGLLGGLVAITGGAGEFSSPQAALVGAAAGIFVPWMEMRSDLIWKLDDPSGLIAVCAGGGLIGTFAGVLLGGGALGDRLHAAGVQAVGLCAIGGVTLLLVGAVMLVLRVSVGVRVKEMDEFDGLDLAEHDLNAYPDFQQTTIKSYHLREM
ncbi:MAG: hypothetical protein ABSF29_00125 [Tepidisphaeraceae bacterium]|jgi:Amt family ammonium transporter